AGGCAGCGAEPALSRALLGPFRRCEAGALQGVSPAQPCLGPAARSPQTSLGRLPPRDWREQGEGSSRRPRCSSEGRASPHWGCSLRASEPACRAQRPGRSGAERAAPLSPPRRTLASSSPDPGQMMNFLRRRLSDSSFIANLPNGYMTDLQRPEPQQPPPPPSASSAAPAAASPAAERRQQPQSAPPQQQPQQSAGSSFFSSLSNAVKQTAASAGLVDAASAASSAAAKKFKLLLVIEEPHTD
ncbi:hypothetical protein KIL84_002824, partial [Mauremys mutica]